MRVLMINHIIYLSQKKKLKNHILKVHTRAYIKMEYKKNKIDTLKQKLSLGFFK